MHSFCVEIFTQTASFRNPEFQNFHKSLDLPPPTTIIGLAGAAMGMSAKMAQDFFDQSKFKLGILGTRKGKTSDTWKYNRRTTNMHLYDSLIDGGVIQRELLIFNHFVLVFTSENKSQLDRLKKGFEFPVFALTMGNSDSLAKVKIIETDLQVSRQSTINNCVVAGDVVGDVLRNSDTNLEFSIYQTSEPITYDLPTRFDYSSDYGKRTIGEIGTFSFINQEMKLNYDIEGVIHQEHFIPIFDL